MTSGCGQRRLLARVPTSGTTGRLNATVIGLSTATFSRAVRRLGAGDLEEAGGDELERDVALQLQAVWASAASAASVTWYSLFRVQAARSGVKVSALPLTLTSPGTSSARC